jgi:OOP family OmpA-OmpF porin
MTDARRRSKDRSDDEQLQELRQLIVGPEKSLLAKLGRRLEDREARTRAVSEVLPEAFVMRDAEDESLAKLLSPSIEEVIRTSVRRNPKVLIDALFPIIGSTIRKAIADAFRNMLQSLNEGLEHSLTLEGLKWRWEAWRSGKSFAEIVLLRTIEYRVEQVFLIHGETGLKIDHLALDSVVAEDPDLVSSMFTAIRDFVKDSFQVGESAAIGELKIGDLTIWVEQGPYAMLAAVIRGNPPVHLREVIQSALEMIHVTHGQDLAAFDGDDIERLEVRPFLSDCLLEKKRPRKKPKYAWGLLTAALVVLVILASLLIWRNVSEGVKLRRYVETLNSQPGILVTSAERQAGQFVIYGLRDPLSTDPVALAESAGISAESVQGYWKPYFASESRFIIQRAEKILHPPASVQLGFSDGVLELSGYASAYWLGRARELAQLIPGVRSLDTGSLEEARSGPLRQLQEQIEGTRIYFALGSSDIDPQGAQSLARIAADLKNLFSEARRAGLEVQLEILGQADNLGSPAFNRVLSLARAETVRARLIEAGVEADRVVAQGAFDQTDVSAERRVSFTVAWDDLEESRR